MQHHSRVTRMRRTKITCCVILKSPDYSVVRTNVNEAVEQTGQERNGPFCRDVPCFSTECVHVSDELVHCSFNLPTLSPFPQFSYIAVSGLSPPPPPPPPPPVETAPPPPLQISGSGAVVIAWFVGLRCQAQSRLLHW